MAITNTRGSYASCDNQNQIIYQRWLDGAKPPKAILQIAHGMAEHIARYDAFARFMASAGYAVYGSDHLGHGASAAAEDDLGYMEKGGGERMPRDLYTLSRIARAEYPGLPLILLGHSMGSFVVRRYAALFGGEIDGLIIMGTSGPNPAAGAGKLLAGLIALFKGRRYRSRFIDNMAFGSYNNSYANPKTKFDWLSRDEAEVKKYIDDQKSGYLFTVGGFQALFDALGKVSKKSWAAELPKTLPVLLVSGAQDPVGAMGKGVAEVADRLKAAGVKNVTLKLFADMRHEILNELGREQVYDYIRDWCDNTLA